MAANVLKIYVCNYHMSIGPINFFNKVKSDLLDNFLKFIDNIIEKLSQIHIRTIGHPICLPLIEMINCEIKLGLRMQ